jgi:hypothetical protein
VFLVPSPYVSLILFLVDRYLREMSRGSINPPSRPYEVLGAKGTYQSYRDTFLKLPITQVLRESLGG